MQEKNSTALNEIISGLKGESGALLPVLHEIQDKYGYIPVDSVPIIAQELNLSKAEISGVITFYHYFRSTLPGNHIIQICCAEACQSMGSDALISHAKSRFGIGFHDTTIDSKVTLEPVYCLGHCACSPSLMIDGRPYGRVTPEKFDLLINFIEEE